MSGSFSVEIERTYPVAVVRPRGVLDGYTAADLRGALLDCLADQPAGVLVDASELSIVDDIGLTVLAAVARQSELWPGSRFAVASGVDVQAAAERLGVTRYAAWCPDRASAVLVLGRWPVPPSRRERIAPDRSAPGLARQAVQEFCAANQVDGDADADAAQLVASELVTNAVVHVGTPIDLTLRLVPPLLHIAVRDGGGGHAKIAGIVNESSESGRGLLLVDALATGWGSFIPNSGKIVWATVRVRSAISSEQVGPDQSKR